MVYICIRNATITTITNRRIEDKGERKPLRTNLNTTRLIVPLFFILLQTK